MCKAKFIDAGDLGKHRRRHTGEDTQEKTHKRRHTGEDTQEKTHRRRHTGEDTQEKTFICVTYVGKVIRSVPI